jgi:hypothetical protein
MNAPERTLTGKGPLRRGERTIGTVNYTIQLMLTGDQAALVQLEPRPPAQDGDLLHVTLEDGRVLNCQMLAGSPYCAVVGDGPITGRELAFASFEPRDISREASAAADTRPR